MTQIIVEALEKTGQRGIINKGWGGLGNCEIFFLYWLFVLLFYSRSHHLQGGSADMLIGFCYSGQTKGIYIFVG